MPNKTKMSEWIRAIGNLSKCNTKIVFPRGVMARQRGRSYLFCSSFCLVTKSCPIGLCTYTHTAENAIHLCLFRRLFSLKLNEKLHQFSASLFDWLLMYTLIIESFCALTSLCSLGPRPRRLSPGTVHFQIQEDRDPTPHGLAFKKKKIFFCLFVCIAAVWRWFRSKHTQTNCHGTFFSSPVQLLF